MPDPSQPLSPEEVIRRMAPAYGVAPDLAWAVASSESAGNPAAIGQPTKTGERARGLFQLMPATAKSYGVDPDDYQGNIEGGLKYLSDLRKKYNGDISAMLTEYHGGTDPANHGPVTANYVNTVIGKLATAAPGAPPPTAPAARQAKPTPSGTAHRVTAQAPAVGAPPPTPLPQYGSKESLAGQPVPKPSSLEQGVEESQGGILGDRPLIEAYNPFTKTGRQNIAGTVGGLAAGALTGGVGWAPMIAAGAGAGVSGGLESAVEGGTPSENVSAAGMQAAQEFGPRAVIWGVQNIGRRFLSHPIAKASAAKIAKSEAALSAFDDAIDKTKQSMRALKLSGGSAAEASRAATEANVAAASKPYEALLASPPPRQAAGEAAARTVEGPAKSTLNAVGERVKAAAESGPPVEVAPLKERINELAAQITPQVAAKEAVPAALAGSSPAALAAMREQAPEAFASMLPDQHPLRGVIGQIQSQLADAGDTIPFAEAHKMKRMLDDAINWDRAAKTQVQQITKGFRQTLRQTMAGHAPYDVATSEYASAVKLFDSGYGKEIIRKAETEPSAFIQRIDPKAPQSAGMLRELLVDLPAQTGDQAAAAQGKQAWDAVRATWTHDKIIKGPRGIAELSDRIAKIEQEPEFAKTFYGDESGQQILQNLKQIAAGYEDAVAKGRIDLSATKRVGETQRLAEGVRLDQLKREKAAAALAVGKREEAFNVSSIATSKERGVIRQHLMDLVRLAALKPTSYLGAASLARLAMGPAASDLVTWAAYSGGPATKALTALFTSQVPGAAAADLLRLWNQDHPEEAGPSALERELSGQGGSAGGVGTPPPAPPPAMRQLLGQPPPQ